MEGSVKLKLHLWLKKIWFNLRIKEAKTWAFTSRDEEILSNTQKSIERYKLKFSRRDWKKWITVKQALDIEFKINK